MRLGWELGRPFPRSACSESNRVSKGRSLAGGSAATSAEIVSKATIVSASSLGVVTPAKAGVYHPAQSVSQTEARIRRELEEVSLLGVEPSRQL